MRKVVVSISILQYTGFASSTVHCSMEIEQEIFRHHTCRSTQFFSFQITQITRYTSSKYIRQITRYTHFTNLLTTTFFSKICWVLTLVVLSFLCLCLSHYQRKHTPATAPFSPYQVSFLGPAQLLSQEFSSVQHHSKNR